MSEKINWFPGHMQKARRQMEEQLKLVDIVIELRDARIPLASQNPLLNELAKDKARLVILNKADYADEVQSKKWKEIIAKEHHCLLVNSLSDNLTKTIVNEVKEILKAKLERAKARGIRKKVLRCMVVGIPNVGKSTLINNIVKKKAARAENRPGVTRSLQWIRLNEDVDLLDTPGVLWPKFEDQNAAMLLALLGSINDDVVDKQQLALFGLNYIRENYPGKILGRYEVDEESEDLLTSIAVKRGWLKNNAEPDMTKCIDMVLKDIRNNNLGRISWEKC